MIAVKPQLSMKGFGSASTVRKRFGVKAAIVLAFTVLGLGAGAAQAVPSFAVQTGQPCQSCHIGGFGPQLTTYGREFKLQGYTARSTAFNIPVSAMAVASYVKTRTDQSSAPAPGFGLNDNTAIDQISLFLAGGLGAHLGAFIQTTYDGVAKAWTWDNLDVRAATTVQVKDTNVVLGVSLNNSPTVQDVWNTLPAWGYPYTSSGLAPAPAAGPLLSGALAQTSLGLTGYAWINSGLFLEGGAYGSPSTGLLNSLGADPSSPGNIRGLAPYGRIAYQKTVGPGVLQVGAFGLRAEIYPGRDKSTGFADRYTDLGMDASWQQILGNGDVITFNGRYLHEQQTLDATCILSGAPPGTAGGCASNTLRDIRADASYFWRNKIGATVAVFNTTGSANPVIYPDSRTYKPDSSGVTFQLDGTPFGGAGSPLGPRFNMRVGIQYTIYARFNGAGANYDGMGASASGNNTLRVFTWFAY